MSFVVRWFNYVFRESKAGFPTDRSKAITLMQLFVCVSVVSYVAFTLSLFVPKLSFFWCLGKAVLTDCGISWVSSLICLKLSHMNLLTKMGAQTKTSQSYSHHSVKHFFVCERERERERERYNLQCKA